MWKAPRLQWQEENELLNGFDLIIKESWPHLTMYFTGKGWIRKETYK